MALAHAIVPTPPSGEQHEIHYGDQRAVVTEVGATLRSYRVGDVDVLDGFGLDEMSPAGRGQILAPWPNRLEDGRFSRYGFDVSAAIDEPARNNAIHGLVRWLPWAPRSEDDSRLELGCILHPQPGYPWRLDLSVAYELGPDGLTVTIAATNLSEGPAPFGVGFHPYVTLGGIIDDALLTIPASRRLLSDGRGLPTSDEPVAGTQFDFTTRRSIGTTQLDTAFVDLGRGDDGTVRVLVEDPNDGRRVAVWAGRGFDYLMVYTGDTLEPALRRRRGIAIEPMTCPPNALATGAGVIRLQPGGSWSGSWGITKEGSHG
jgi:aldose 1-epimerase